MSKRNSSGTDTVAGHHRAERVITVATIALPFVAVAVAIVVFWGQGITLLDLLLCAALYLVTAGGIAMGFHRLFTHKSFKCTPAVKWALGIGGSMAAQGPLLYWAALHRRHHQHSDNENDPHSPHAFEGAGGLAVLR
ncbi:MAG TPA: hypothetical protein VM029_23190, partial [Opitutaceae bacterium]|nr:hypothetical protein [Opitutaceae bacterium]